MDCSPWRPWWALNPPNRRGTDPYARWCGRGGVVRRPPIPIDGRLELTSSLEQVGSPPAQDGGWRGYSLVEWRDAMVSVEGDGQFRPKRRASRACGATAGD